MSFNNLVRTQNIELGIDTEWDPIYRYEQKYRCNFLAYNDFSSYFESKNNFYHYFRLYGYRSILKYKS
jgi:hypothetical protein